MKTKLHLTLLALALSLPLAQAQAQDDAEALKKQIAELEKKVAALEKKTAPLDAAALVEKNREKARERMREDSKEYSREELREIETLYQVANKNWRTQEAKDSLETLVKKYKKANRTGCAILYLGQMSKGAEREKYLAQAVEDFSDCYYGDGCIVGGYARYLLGLHYKEEGKPDEMKKIFDEIRADYPDATSHKGQRITDWVDKV